MSTADTSHLSIGEVLSLLQEEFPDVTISKIRFLESQGLIDPERTPSGYRKFYEGDVERLRWILQQQRDHFLPLKVIKDRLADAERGLPLKGGADPSPAGSVVVEPTVVDEKSADSEAIESNAAPRTPPVDEESTRVPEVPTDEQTPRSRPSRPAVADSPLDSGPTEMSLTADELPSATGLSRQAIDELQRYGLLITRQVGPDRFFDGDAVIVARAAAGFAEFGVGARHLRMYKVSSEREAGFFEQVIMPLLKQRNPSARQRAIETVGAMASLGQQLHAALLRQALDDSLG